MISRSCRVYYVLLFFFYPCFFPSFFLLLPFLFSLSLFLFREEWAVRREHKGTRRKKHRYLMWFGKQVDSNEWEKNNHHSCSFQLFFVLFFALFFPFIFHHFKSIIHSFFSFFSITFPFFFFYGFHWRNCLSFRRGKEARWLFNWW